MARIEFKIGDELTVGARKLKVVPWTTCLNCALHDVDCITMNEFVGYCAIKDRKDKTSIMFIDITDTEDIEKSRTFNVVSEDGDLYYGSYEGCLNFIKEHPELNLTEDDIIEE